ncbi:DapH/DapD/GlmU-related protein [Flavobacterium tructae]|uniref:DapH/DapD/GlmU-related protein n=1 Tax=Flavobacterium tructae TaxID=1114873 RepID=UPI0025520110|nr:DapH/DapD/GlmU-related protein [Flavobacterium tructae]MDL2143331.1 DapH/DapD/GlmU-related protein [Flavobacterium tructae]
MLKIYGIWGCFNLLKSWLFTRLFYPSARLIMLPTDIRGKKNILWGNNFRVGVGCRLEAYGSDNKILLEIGDNVQLNDYVHITAMSKVTIGNDVLMASKIYISDCTHGNYSNENSLLSSPLVKPSLREMFAKEVVIGNNVWIGESVSILPGVSIGDGSIVGANSVVTKSLPANVIAVGIPAMPIKFYDFEKRCWTQIIKNNDI